MAKDRVPLTWGAKRLRLAVEAVGIALFSWNIDNDLFEMDDRGYALWGLMPSGAARFRALSHQIHASDRDRVRTAFAMAGTVGREYEIDFRVTADGGDRWISARGKGEDRGVVDRVMFGIFQDISDRKHAEESRELLADEMSHRVKNLLTIASGLTGIAARSSRSVSEMATSLTQRLAALGRAHDLTRRVPDGEAHGAWLGELLGALLTPYQDESGLIGRIGITVPRLRVGEQAATTLALVFHELATNSLKYGALSTLGGTLKVSERNVDKGVMLQWIESGGPPVKAFTQSPGFGSTLIRRSLEAQLNGSIGYDWSTDGVVITLLIDPERLQS